MTTKTIEYLPEGRKINTAENSYYFKNQNSLTQAFKERIILESRAIICDSGHNLIVDLGCMKGIIPREEGAIGIKEGAIKDVALISRVNKPVCFYITDFITVDGNVQAVLSRKQVQLDCRANYLSKLISGDIIDACVTHLEPFGAFVDVGCGVSSLIPIDSISISRIDHPRERFSLGMNIKVIVKENDSEGRICLSHKELLGTWEENARMFTVGETVAGVIRSVEDYGIFVELMPNLAGLAEPKEGAKAGQQASVYIKNLIPEKMKIKLIIIDSFSYDYTPTSPDYFYKEKHISSFVYSPDVATRVIKTQFDDEDKNVVENFSA